jgi:hypothetical protein
MGRINVFSDADVALIREMAAEFKRRKGNPPVRSQQQHVPPQAPEVYIGKTGSLGIPALNDVFVGTGSVYDMPGGTPTLCDIYKIVTYNDVARLVPAGFQKPVFNLSNTGINGFVWFMAMRDKFGTWIAVDACCNDVVPADVPGVCGSCAETVSQYCVKFPGLTNDGTFCTSCADFALESIVLTWQYACVWSGASDLPVCIGSWSPGTAFVVLTITEATAFLEVYFAAQLVALYSVDLTSWDCVTNGTFTGANIQGTCANWPATVTVYPNATCV